MMKIGNFCSLLLGMFFLLMLVMPTTFQMERGVMLALLAMTAGIASLQGKWQIHRDILLLSLLTITTSLALMLRGAMADGPGALRVATVYVVWPLLYLLFIGIAYSEKNILPLLKILTVATIVAALMGIWVVSDALGIGPSGSLDLLEFQGASVGVTDGSFEYRLFNMTTIIYALPFLIAGLFVPAKHSIFKGRWRAIAWFALCLTAIAMLISGRRMFWLLGLLSPLIVGGIFLAAGLPFRHLLTRSMAVFGSLLGVFVLGAIALGVDIGMLAKMLLSGFDFSGGSEQSASVRGTQFIDLMDGWQEHPLFGAGHGVSAPNVIRSVEQPWAYELSYLALLYQAGLFGFMVYGAAILWIFWTGTLMVRRNPRAAGVLIPLLAGLLGFLISNATNPYLTKFDYLWTIFLPVAAINAYFKESRKSISSSSTGTPVASLPTA